VPSQEDIDYTVTYEVPVPPDHTADSRVLKVYPVSQFAEIEKYDDGYFGVVNLIHGGADTVNAILDHPLIRGITFVGSTNVAKHIYSRASANGKRVQAQGGAKNPVIVLPDADMQMATQIISDSAFGCAGQRCLAVSVAVTVGEAQKTFRDSITEAAANLRVGNGLDEGVQMGTVITRQSKERVQNLIGVGARDGAKVVLDGRTKGEGTQVEDNIAHGPDGETTPDPMDTPIAYADEQHHQPDSFCVLTPVLIDVPCVPAHSLGIHSVHDCHLQAHAIGSNESLPCHLHAVLAKGDVA
jgi:hypothetical protein